MFIETSNCAVEAPKICFGPLAEIMYLGTVRLKVRGQQEAVKAGVFTSAVS
jgi:hypothetical protein